MKHSGVRTKNKTARGALVFGIALNVAAFFICTLVSSAIILSTDNPTGNVGMGSMISFFICAAICGFAVWNLLLIKVLLPFLVYTRPPRTVEAIKVNLVYADSWNTAYLVA